MRQLIPCEKDIEPGEDLEAVYAPPPGRHLRADFVASLDGAVEVQGRSGPLGGPADRAAFMAMRAVSDVVLVGAGTVSAENYGPVKLAEDVQQRRRWRGQSALPPLAIVSARGDLDPGSRAFTPPGRPLLLTTSQVASSRADLAAVAEVIPCGDAYVDLDGALGELSSRGLEAVLCEGGPTLLRSLMAIGLLDEMCLTIAPVLAGTGPRRMMGDSPLPELAEFRLTGLLEGDGMLLTRYEYVRPS
jgi:riboflavin biosynthesis pyrimidine reductase